MDHLIIIAFPDFYIHYHPVWHRVVWKFLGFTEGNTIRAGHNCAILVDGDSGGLEYYDFGRYDVPDGYGRARTAQSDPQLALPIKANNGEGKITNLEDIMEQFYDMDYTHHSAGPMYYKVLPSISRAKVKSFVHDTQARGFVDYDIFRKGALNCSRYIGELVKAVLPQDRITTFLKHICPSPTPMDTLINGDVHLATMRYDGETHSTHQLSPWDGIKYYLRPRGAFHNDTSKIEMPDCHWIGSKAMGSYYKVKSIDHSSTQFNVLKFSAKGQSIWEKHFLSELPIDVDKNFEFLLGHSPDAFVIKQGEMESRLVRLSSTISI